MGRERENVWVGSAVPMPPREGRGRRGVRPVVLGYVAGLATGLLCWAAWSVARPRTDWEKIALETSPEYLMAVYDAHGPVPANDERIAMFAEMIGRAGRHYEEDPRLLCFVVLTATADLARSGHPASAFAVLHGALKVAEARRGVGREKGSIRAFAELYRRYREAGRIHNQAVDDMIAAGAT